MGSVVASVNSGTRVGDDNVHNFFPTLHGSNPYDIVHYFRYVARTQRVRLNQQEVNRAVLGRTNVIPRTALATLVSRQAVAPPPPPQIVKPTKRRKSGDVSGPVRHRRISTCNADVPVYPAHLRYPRSELAAVLSTFDERDRKKIYDDML